MQQSDKFSRHLVLDPHHRGKKKNQEMGPRKTEGGKDLPVWCPGVLTFLARAPATGRASLPNARKLV